MAKWYDSTVDVYVQDTEQPMGLAVECDFYTLWFLFVIEQGYLFANQTDRRFINSGV